MVTVIAFLLRRYTNVRARAEMAYRRKFWRNMMPAAGRPHLRGVGQRRQDARQKVSENEGVRPVSSSTLGIRSSSSTRWEGFLLPSNGRSAHDAIEGANHFIVNQLAHLAEMEVKHRCNHILEMGGSPSSLLRTRRMM